MHRAHCASAGISSARWVIGSGRAEHLAEAWCVHPRPFNAIFFRDPPTSTPCEERIRGRFSLSLDCEISHLEISPLIGHDDCVNPRCKAEVLISAPIPVETP